MSMHLDDTFGAAFIGTVVAAALYGVTCVQALYYYTNQNDPWYIKFTVTVVMIFDTVHQALISHTVYTYAITDWGNPVQVGLIVWSLEAGVLFSGLMAFVVHSFLVMRIWRLSGRNIYLTGIPMILAAAGFVTIILNIAAVQLFPSKQLTEIAKTKGFSIAVTIVNAITDLVIAGTLCTLLYISRTGSHKLEVIINRLIMFTVNTGLLTSLCALASLISLLAAGKTFIYMAFFFCLCRLYANTFLATLNAREIIRNLNERGADVFPLRDFHTHELNQTSNLSIKIDTITQKHHPGDDQKLEEKTPGSAFVTMIS